MKFRFISRFGDAGPLALHCSQVEQGDVDIYLHTASAKALYDGMIDRVDKPTAGDLDKEDTLFIFDMVGMGSLAEKLKSQGYRVLGAGAFPDNLELDRGYGTRVMRTTGIKIPETKLFTSFDKAKAWIKTNRRNRYVFKPLDNKSTALTYVSSSREDLETELDILSKRYRQGLSFILQEYVEGIEVSIEAWYAEGNLVPFSINSTLESKRFMNDDKGPNTGCSLDVVWIWKKVPKLYKQTLGKLAPLLKKMKYTGPLDINCIVNKQGVYGLEFTSRFGYNAIYTLFELFDEKFTDFFDRISKGDTGELKANRRDFAISVRCSVPPYPHSEDARNARGILIKNISPEESSHIWLMDAYLKEGEFLCAGVDGVIAVVTSSGKTVTDARRKVYEVIDKVSDFDIPDLQYRTDAGINAIEERLPQLKKLGMML